MEPRPIGCRRPCRGFSLQELVIVIVVLSIGTALVLPRLGNSIARRRVEMAARRVAVDLALAQQNARMTSRSQKVFFDLVQETYTLTGMRDPDRPAAEYVVNIAAEPYGAALDKTTLGGDTEVIFDGYGVPDSGGSILLSVGDYKRQVDIDPDTGAASVK